MKYLLILRDTKAGDEWVHPAHFDFERDAQKIGEAFKRMDSQIVYRIKPINPINVAEGRDDHLGVRAG